MENRRLNWTFISKRDFIINALLFANIFSFYYIFDIKVIPLSVVVTGGSPQILQACFIFSIALSILLISQISKKLEKKHILTFTGLSLASLPFLFLSPIFELSVILVLLIGATFGISQLAFYVYFWKTTKTTERGRLGGLLGLIALPLYFISFNFISNSLDFFGNIILCVTFCSFILFGALSIKENNLQKNKPNLAYYPEKRTIFLYSVPWILFSFLNFTLSNNIAIDTAKLVTPSFFAFLSISQVFGGIVGTILGGFMADRGRRLTLIISITLYGISTTFKAFLNNDITFFFAFIAEGISWGILLTLYSFVIWGDLANSKNVSKLYSIGLIGYYITMGIGLLPSFLSEISALTSALISCLLIFLSYLPIMLAPELLSSDIQEKDKIKKYMDTVKKIADKTDDQ